MTWGVRICAACCYAAVLLCCCCLGLSYYSAALPEGMTAVMARVSAGESEQKMKSTYCEENVGVVAQFAV